MPTPVRDKYYLRSLHEEIALFDRKLAHLLRYETFPSEKDRNTAAAKMSVKRGQLVASARLLVEQGVEFLPSDLPRSMRADEAAGEMPVEDAPAEVAAAEPATREQKDDLAVVKTVPFRDDVREYLLNRKRGAARLASS